MIKVRAFSHTSQTVTDVERSTNFYEKVLGLKQLPRPDFPFGGAWYGIGANQIHLISSDKRESGISPLNPHFALEVEDFDETKRTLDEMGIEYLEAASNMSGRQLWILDPDGNTIELRQEN